MTDSTLPQEDLRTPQGVWDAYKKRLEEGNDKGSVEAWGELWAGDGRFIVKYDERIVEDKTGHKQLEDFIFGASKKVASTEFKNDLVFKIENSDIFFVKFDLTIILTNDYPYENRIVCKVTLDKQGKIKKFVEYGDPVARERFLRELESIP